MLAADGRCDLHVHSRFSTDSGNYALRRARLAESYTHPERVYHTCRERGMRYVTITDHNTVEGALRIAHLPETFVSVEVTTRFPEDDVPLHVLVWNLTEEDHRDLQPYRPSVLELVAFLRERGLFHALAHPLYRMGPPLTRSHVERMMLLFSVWEGRNGARPKESNDLACRLAEAVSPEYVAKLADKHLFEPVHDGRITLTGGSDDHGALDIATTWTEAPGESVGEFLSHVVAGESRVGGDHGSALKLAHAVAALAVNAYREDGGELSPIAATQVRALFDENASSASERHEEIRAATVQLARALGERVRRGGIGLSTIDSVGPRLAALAYAGALQAPYLASAHHQAGSRADLTAIESAFFGIGGRQRELWGMVFTDTYDEANGVAGTMRRLAADGGAGAVPVRVAAARAAGDATEGLIAFVPDWTVPLPTYEQLELRFPLVTDVLERVEAERPSVIHVATPGPVGVCGLVAAKLLGIPLVGSYHTELGPYALHLTRDLLVSQAMELWVDWFYRRCDAVLAPTSAVAEDLRSRGYPDVDVWGRGVDTSLFHPGRRRDDLRRSLLEEGSVLLVSVGRVSEEKRLGVLLDAYGRLREAVLDARLVVVGDGPARAQLESTAPPGTRFLGELRGDALADVYAAADIFCFPSTTDTFGQVLLEAAASGLPAVASAAGGATELVAHGATGLLVPPDDAAALGEALKLLVGDPQLRRRLGENALQRARGHSWAAAHEQLLAAYRSLGAGESPQVPSLAAL